VEALTAIYGLRSDLVSFLRNMRSDYVHLREQIGASGLRQAHLLH